MNARAWYEDLTDPHLWAFSELQVILGLAAVFGAGVLVGAWVKGRWTKRS